jgi:hypothetical protein
MEQPILRTKEFGDLPIVQCHWREGWGLYMVIVDPFGDHNSVDFITYSCYDNSGIFTGVKNEKLKGKVEWK